MILVFIMRVKEKAQPYKNPLLNYIDSMEHYASIITFYGALFFIADEISPPIEFAVFIVIVIMNAWFFTVWAYALGQTYAKYAIVNSVVSFIGKYIIPKKIRAEELDYRYEKRQ